MDLVSEAGSGSEFSSYLTFERANDAQLSVSEMAHLDVLVADDNPITHEAMHRATVALDWNAQIVDSGEAALENVFKECGGSPGKVICSTGKCRAWMASPPHVPFVKRPPTMRRR